MEFDLIVEGFNVIGMRLIIKKKKVIGMSFRGL